MIINFCICRECGDLCKRDESGIVNHVGIDGNVNHDADADHVAIPESED